MARALGRPAVAVLICILGLSLAPGASAAPVAAHWAMDETSGTTAFDDSGNGINATLTNVTLGQPGATGHSYLFDSTSKMVIPKALGGLTPGTLPVTITMQVRTSHRPGTGNFDFDMWSESGYQLEIYPRKGLAQARCKFKSSTQKIVIQDGPEPFHAAVRELTGDERAEWWTRAVADYPPYAEYQTKTDRLIPVFVLEPVDG